MLNGPFIERYFSEMRQIVDTISREDIDRAIEALFSAWRDGRTVFLMGNGGSASTATHFTAPGCHLSALSVNNGQPPIIAQPVMSGLACMTCSTLAAASWAVSL